MNIRIATSDLLGRRDLAEYVTEKMNSIEGWLYPHDVSIICAINAIQSRFGLLGDILELGVWKGKSLILLALLSQEEEQLVGVDMFPDSVFESAHQNLLSFVPEKSNQVKLEKVDTAELTHSDLMDYFSKPLRLAHIDAGHEYHEVIHSLVLVAPMMSTYGVLVLDDYCDREFPGIEAAMYGFLGLGADATCGFVPFCLGHNKIYLCHRAMSQAFQLNLLRHSELGLQCKLTKLGEVDLIVPNARHPQEGLQKKLLKVCPPSDFSVRKLLSLKSDASTYSYSRLYE